MDLADRKFEKNTPDRKGGVYEENSDFRGKKTNRLDKNMKYIVC